MRSEPSFTVRYFNEEWDEDYELLADDVTGTEVLSYVREFVQTKDAYRAACQEAHPVFKGITLLQVEVLDV
jgi:hypothetical protein